MELTSHEVLDGAVIVIAGRGDLNAASCDRLERELLRRVEAGQRRLVLDLGEVRYVSSAGLRVFLVAARAVGREGAFVLARPAATVKGILDLAGFGTIMKVVPELEAAVTLAAGG